MAGREVIQLERMEVNVRGGVGVLGALNGMELLSLFEKDFETADLHIWVVYLLLWCVWG